MQKKPDRNYQALKCTPIINSSLNNMFWEVCFKNEKIAFFRKIDDFSDINLHIAMSVN